MKMHVDYSIFNLASKVLLTIEVLNSNNYQITHFIIFQNNHQDRHAEFDQALSEEW